MPAAIVMVLALLLTGAPAAAGPLPEPAAAGAAPPTAAADWRLPDGTPQSVTLITGDQVTLIGSGFTVQPGPGRSEMLFQAYRSGDHHYVIPVDAIELVEQRRLDRRLFDVAGLLRSGYGDADTDDLPLIVAHESPAAGLLGVPSLEEAQPLPAVGLTATRAPKQEIGQLWATLRGEAGGGAAAAGSALPAGVSTIWLDGQRELDLSSSVHQVNAPAAWDAGWTGAGVTVAVLDSGIDSTHPDFAGRIVEVRNFTDAPDGNDTLGHGTHVASILAGSGAASGGAFQGIAPDAELLVGKVCPTQTCPESAILAGMAWAAEQGAAVVNLSLSGPDAPGIDPLEQAVNELTEQFGTLFVASAGNLGPVVPVGSPASADAALAVGSVDGFNGVSNFSSPGPRVGDAAVKPDLTAPGEFIVAARAAGTSMGDPINADYTSATGTSMSAPHVAGAAALLAQQHPDWHGPQLKAALMGSAAQNFGATVFQQGAGLLDLSRAIDQTVVTQPPSISFGRSEFPHDGQPLQQVVTYHNLGAEQVELNLNLNVLGPDGFLAPFGMFGFGPSSLTLPPGGQADVTVTANVATPSALGHFSGDLTATGGGTIVRTPVGLDKEEERYELSVTHRDRDGTPTGNYLTHVLGVDAGHNEEAFGGSPTATFRLPPGQYHLYSVVRTPTADGQLDASVLAQPLIELTGDMSLTLDARAAQPMRVTVPRDSARSSVAVLQYERRAPLGRPIGAAVVAPDLDHIYTAQLGPAVAADEVVSSVHSHWGEPGAEGDFMDTPYAYHLAWFERGRLWTGFERQVASGDLAAVATQYRTPMPGRIGQHAGLSFAPEGSLGAGHFFRNRLPFQRTNYYLADDVAWLHEVHTMHPQTNNVETSHTSPFVSYSKGWQGSDVREISGRWNHAVFGPAFPDAGSQTQWAYRHHGALPTVAGTGVTQGSDSIAVGVPLFIDSTPQHIGSSLEDSGRTALYRDGELIGETASSRSGEFPVPDQLSTYRLEVEGSRASFAELSTHVSGVWTFQSGHDPAADPVRLPVMAIQFSPSLDEHNRARAGQPLQMPVTVHRQAGTGQAVVASLEVEVSYDEGESWQPVPVQLAGGQWRARLRHPASAEYVSLRGAAVDHEGNSVEITIIRAYRLDTVGPVLG